jgi:hypothetical protein
MSEEVEQINRHACPVESPEEALREVFDFDDIAGYHHPCRKQGALLEINKS